MRKSREFEEALHAAEDFAALRLVEKVEGQILYARLYVNALRGLDVYGPTLNSMERMLEEELGGECRDSLRNAMRGLRFLLDARYHPSYLDHRVLPTLHQYHEALNLVEENLRVAVEECEALKPIYDNFVEAVESVVSGNGVYVVNWKMVPEQCFTLYSKVNLRIARLAAGGFIGVYVVRVKDRVPLHAHRYLDEHHFLPEPIRGVHQLGDEACRALYSDIVYINHGQIHGFRNDEGGERAFVFICGSPKTGPWDFVQDIETFPDLDFPKDEQLVDDVEKIGGRRLEEEVDKMMKSEGNPVVRLSPGDMALFHDMVRVGDIYPPPNEDLDLQYFVAEGYGTLEIEGRTAHIEKGDVFVIQKRMKARITGGSQLILHQFGYTQ